LVFVFSREPKFFQPVAVFKEYPLPIRKISHGPFNFRASSVKHLFWRKASFGDAPVRHRGGLLAGQR
jgi:hypothetical protein